METASNSAFLMITFKRKYKEEDFKLKNLRCSFFVVLFFVCLFVSQRNKQSEERELRFARSFSADDFLGLGRPGLVL